MAGVEWSACKCKGGTEAKGKMLLFDKEQQMKYKQNNLSSQQVNWEEP